MSFTLTEQQAEIREHITRLCAGFDDAYWLARDRDGDLPRRIPRRPWPRAAGSASPCPRNTAAAASASMEAAMMMRAVAESGACMTGASAIHMNIFGLNPVVVFGTEAQKQRLLPPLIAGREKACFGGDRAQCRPQHDRPEDARREARRPLRGATARRSGSPPRRWPTSILLLARTTPLDKVKQQDRGADACSTPTLDRAKVEVRLIEKMGRHAVDSNMLFFDGLRDPGGGPHRRGRPGLPPDPARHEPRAHADRRRGGRHRPCRAAAGVELCARSASSSAARSAEPGDPASAGALLGGARSGLADDDEGGRAVRRRPGVRGGGECGEIPRRRGRASTRPRRR